MHVKYSVWDPVLMSLFLLTDVVLKFRQKIDKLEKEIYAVLQLEKEEKMMQHSEAQVCDICLGFHTILLSVGNGRQSDQMLDILATVGQ